MEKNYVPSVDEKLFSEMKNAYVSEKENEFFEKMQYKEEQESTFSNDVIVSEFENTDELYVVRRISHKYTLGKGMPEKRKLEYFVDSLSDALQTNLKDIGILDENITLLEWLRKRDYAGVKYDGNNDYR
ncbi:MAG: hypothetical protein J6X18_01655 [Bacteroidales bacterium]|nr:hypothetical protein [Bacteroidales bacterium]